MADSKILVNLAHPDLAKSKLNKSLVAAISDLPEVTINELYTHYPTWQIDVAREQKLLTDAEVAVFQFPFYWYSTPALLKEWEDRVLTWGWAFGTSGTALVGKKVLLVITTGGPEEVYNKEGKYKYTVEELIVPLRQSFDLCGMIWQTPIIVHGAMSISDEELKKKGDEYRNLLLTLSN